MLKGGRQKSITLNGVDYQGADMFIINPYFGKDCVVLFQQIDMNGKPYLQLPGGRCDEKHQSLEDTICDELYEESKKSIRVSKGVFEGMTKAGSFVEYDGGMGGIPGRRRCFVAKVPKISETKFNKNRTIFEKKLENAKKQREQDELHAFMETKKMVRIPLAQLGEIIAAGNRHYNGIRIGTFVLNAYREMTRMQNPIINIMSIAKHFELDNDNIFKSVGLELRGKIDLYRKKE